MEPSSPEKNESEFPGVAKASALSLGLDDYEDIFSDFDPRPYSERMLSDDFLRELKRAAVDREESGLTLTLLVPKDKRSASQEKVILERLKGHFRRQKKRLEERRRDQTRSGIRMVLLGTVFMFLATWMLQYEKSLWSTFTVVLLEPAGWFTFWEGLGLIFLRSRETAPELIFYRKMSGSKINFQPPPETVRPKKEP